MLRSWGRVSYPAVRVTGVSLQSFNRVYNSREILREQNEVF